MHFRIEREDDVSFIHPVGKFDGGSDSEQLQTLITEMAESGCHKVVFSFSLTRWINSCGVGKLIAAKFVVDEYNGRFVLCDLGERNMSVINTLRLDQIFEIYDSLQDAAEALKLDSFSQTPP
ncbi:MAG: STAS domain-containing protein [Candidatus Krumholzibacteria bacterium]|nr:STAS domain-containing protein [Candidatus Krumholzibacteria bacterium]